ncbi:DUF4957 domain-containing protein [Pedobacter duraquae]|uniref:Uncharacterized protein DUF4957 n=1 Tax=Pedobacter duraquae TaxID=425511 RepID=A0A4V3C422_9SPHI|nr:DUF4957 domain-containing protein [Pedobacter duraquae]TDO24218.1 uncharacterized protein DUF4957 [Pedobacter duraquae]
MRTYKISFPALALLFGLLLTFFSACKKDDPNEGLEPQRLFKVSGVSVRTDQTTAKVTWTKPVLSSNLKLSYMTEFSQDSTFKSTEFSIKVDTIGVIVTDAKVSVRKKYWVRIKALATETQPESQWITSVGGFSISGEQLFLPVRDAEVLETQVTLRWKPTTGLDKITMTATGAAEASYTISASEATTGVKVITGLTGGLEYSTEIYQAGRSKGILNIKTPAPVVYSVILNPGDDITAAINNAANNAVIGLRPGTYSAGTNTFNLVSKTITLKSTSGNPADTKVNYREFTLKGTGAGIILDGLELDGTASGALYFINLTGVLADAEPAVFTQVNINNCTIHDAQTSLMRANRGDYKMDQIVVKNSLVYNIGSNLSYICFHLDKLQFTTMNITKSTFYNFGQALITASTVVPIPPTINIDYSTFNNFGSNARYVLLDANANPIKFNVTNSIIANTPRSAGSVNGVAIRASGAGSTIVFSNNNTFNFTNGSGATLTLPTTNTSQANNQSIALGWTLTTTNFTLPAASPLRTASNSGSPIGDPRWTY